MVRKPLSAALRVLIAFAIGVAAGLIAAPFAPWQLSVVLGWDAAAVFMITAVWVTVGRFDAAQTRASALREDNSRVATHIIIVSASLVSLVGVGFELHKAAAAHGGTRAFLIVVGLLTAASAWALIHTVFALRYAHEFYSEPQGGVDFKSAGYLPDYHDFAYLAFTVGMTFQVSDTDIQQSPIRRTVLRHALLSYLFGALIIAVTVNTIAQFL